jgi:hypothetical protein
VEVGLICSAHMLLSSTVQNNISLLYAKYEQCACGKNGVNTIVHIASFFFGQRTLVL